jgi:UDP-2,3-diacylglucosamine pyrophosphatase LpxH
MEKKTIFISDIHMNDERSLVEGKYKPYGWLTATRAIELTSFLRKIADTSKVSEIVILGDIIDTWVCPFDIPPQNTESVLKAWQNKPIIDALVEIIGKNIKVTYVIGNHDMLIDVQILKQYIPGINFIGYGEGMTPGTYYSGRMHGEHGNAYAMFNAPDCENSFYQNLPLGYFISRIAASQLAEIELGKITDDVLPDHEELANIVGLAFKKSKISKAKDLQKKRETLPELVVDTICTLRGIKITDQDKTMIVMPDNTQVSILLVKEKYANLYRQWVEKYGQDYAFMAFYAEAGHLSHAANIIINRNEADIVLFGHTHIKKEKNEDRENTIYANTGTWCEYPKKPYTYVESQLDLNEKTHQIRLMKWMNGKVRQIKKMSIPNA